MIYIYLFVYSSIIFSFIHVAAKAIPQKQSFLFRFSECDVCHQPLGMTEIIPIVSYCWNKGRAKCCGSRIQISYLVFELLCPITICCFFSELEGTQFLLASMLFMWLTFFTLTDCYYLHIPNVAVYFFLLSVCLFRYFTEFEFFPILQDFIGSGLFFWNLIFLFQAGDRLRRHQIIDYFRYCCGFFRKLLYFLSSHNDSSPCHRYIVSSKKSKPHNVFSICSVHLF